MKIPGYVSKREHEAVVAAKDAEIAHEGFRRLVDGRHLRRERDKAESNLQSAAWELRSAEKRIASLEARLAVFTAPRTRDERGRFKSGREQVS